MTERLIISNKRLIELQTDDLADQFAVLSKDNLRDLRLKIEEQRYQNKILASDLKFATDEASKEQAQRSYLRELKELSSKKEMFERARQMQI